LKKYFEVRNNVVARPAPRPHLSRFGRTRSGWSRSWQHRVWPAAGLRTRLGRPPPGSGRLRPLCNRHHRGEACRSCPFKPRSKAIPISHCVRSCVGSVLCCAVHHVSRASPELGPIGVRDAGVPPHGVPRIVELIECPALGPRLPAVVATEGELREQLWHRPGAHGRPSCRTHGRTALGAASTWCSVKPSKTGIAA
jgi:hypothetical protein